LDLIETPEYHAQGLMTSLWHDATPMVVRLHTPAYLCRQVNAVGFGGSGWDTWMSEQAERWTARRAALVTSPSRALAQDVAEHWGMRADDVRVIPNPIDEELFCPSDAAMEQTNNVAEVLCVGRLERRKGVQTLVDAWPLILAAAPHARLVFVGDDHASGPGATSMKAHLKRCLTDAGVPEQTVRFAGAVARSALPDVYRCAQACVVPSLYENFPYVCLEAMACGRPVVASRVGGIPEIVSDGIDGLLCTAGDPATLAAAVVRLLNDQGLRQQLGTRARQTICRRFSRVSVSAQTACAYERMLMRPPASYGRQPRPSMFSSALSQGRSV
jgi:glycosyltransferase involved in cell wall biosynthesis